MRLHETDHAIIRELIGWSEGHFPEGALTVSARVLADRTGLHRNTVTRRLKALREGGVLEGFLYEPNPSWLGLVRAGHSFQGTTIPDADDLTDRLRPFPNVAIAALHADSVFLHTWHAHEEEMRKDVRALASLLGAARATASFVSSRFPAHAADAASITALDRRLLLALRRGHDRSVTRIAEAAGVNRRTAARRLDRLVALGGGALLPMVRPGRIEGEVLVVYDTDERGEHARESLRTAFPDRIMGPTGRNVSPMVLVPMPNVNQAVRRQAEIAALPGLAGVRLSLLRDWLFPPACDAWLAEHVQNAPPAAANP